MFSKVVDMLGGWIEGGWLISSSILVVAVVEVANRQQCAILSVLSWRKLPFG